MLFSPHPPDLQAIDRYWDNQAMPFSLAAMEDGFGSSLSLERLAKSDLIPTVTTQHVADGEKQILARAYNFPWKNLLAGGVAGAISRSVVAPIERLKLLLQMQGNGSSNSGESSSRRYTGGLRSGLRQMYREDGARGLYKGNLSNILRIVPVVGLQFAFYDVYKKFLFGRHASEESVAQRLLSGSAAGMTACLLTYPLDTSQLLSGPQRKGKPEIQAG